MFHFCDLLFLFFIAGDAVKLKPIGSVVGRYRRENADEYNIDPTGKHVCIYEESMTSYYVRSYTRPVVGEDLVCCEKFLWCWRHCKIAVTHQKTVYRKTSRLTTLKVAHCCQGWSVDPKTKTCTKAVCQPYCRNGGFCKGPNECQCNPGFTGTFCQLDIDECEMGMAKCTQRCVNLPGTFQCLCNKGFYPDTDKSEECIPIEFCRKKPCHCGPTNDTNCCDMPEKKGDYFCKCRTGYRIARKNLCVDRNECWENPDRCPALSECVNTKGSFYCKCLNGFEKDTDRKKCIAVDFCAKMKGGCHHNCIPITGSYVCTCKRGYILAVDQHSCTDINECNGMDPCDTETSVCENTPGSYSCKCKDGFSMKVGEIICDDDNECEQKTAKCHMKCTNTYGSYTCGCNPGYRLAPDGHQCLDVDECKQGSTYCTQRCVNTIGSYACGCYPGYKLDVNKKRCHPRPCADTIAPYYGQAVCDGYVVGKRCQFSCQEGYELSGPWERVCKTTGKWSGAEAVCKPKQCGPPTPPPYGKAPLTCDTSYLSTCPITCLDGYILRGNDKLKCDIVYNRLKWDTRNTKCEEILVCKPNPCMNKGRCSIVTDTEYYCNCTNTGHTGKDCDLLVVNMSPIPKLTVGVRSPVLRISSKPLDYVTVRVYPEDPGIVYSTTSFDVHEPHLTLGYTIKSNVTGLNWVTYETSSSERVNPVPDSLLFFGSSTPTVLPGFSLLHKDSNCYNVHAKPKECPSKTMKFSSTGWWETRPGSLVSTDGLIFVEINSLKFPLALASVSVLELFNDFKSAADLTITTQPASASCKQTDLTESELDYTITNDIFTKDLLAQYNKLTPDWFKLNLDSPLKNVHSNNIQAFVWPAARVKSEPACSGAAIDQDSLFLVYLHHEQLTMRVNGKTISLNSKYKFCLLVDVCTHEPHLVMPPDNYGTLETVFSFQELQTMGWNIGVKSVGFRNSAVKDGRKCSNINGTQVAFGATNMTYKYKKTISGGVQGDMFVNIINNRGKHQVSPSEQCFDGKSRFDTPAWFTTDNFHKRYTKSKPAHNVIQTKSSKPSPKHDMVSVIQGKNSIFEMKTGLRPVVQTSNSEMNLRVMYKEARKKKVADEENDEMTKILALQSVSIPLDDLNMVLEGIDITSEPLKTKFETFRDAMTEWAPKLSKDVMELMMHSTDTELVLSTIRNHYYKLSQAIIDLKQLVIELKHHHVDPDDIDGIEDDLDTFVVVEAKLKKYSTIDKPTKSFEHVILNFMGKMCLLSPCMDNVNVTLYPMTYDLGLHGLCNDPEKGPDDMWQTEVHVTQSETKGQFFSFEKGGRMYLCLSRHGVNKGHINAAIKLLGTQVKDRYTLQDKTIKMPPTKIKMFTKYDFIVNSTINLELGNWNMASIRSYGYTNDGSPFIVLLQKYLDGYALNESLKITKRLADALDTKKQMLTETVNCRHSKKKAEDKVKGEEKKAKSARATFARATRQYEDAKNKYDARRAEMTRIEDMIKNMCTIKMCRSECNRLPTGAWCQQPVYVDKSIISCHVEVENRSYAFQKAEKSVCSHQVTDYGLKSKGACSHPNVPPEEAKSIIERLKTKIKNKIPLTEEDAIELKKVNDEKGNKLLEEIEERNVLINFPRKLQDGVVTDEEFILLAKYKGQTFADKMRNTMRRITEAKVLQLMSRKINEGQTLTEEDYARIRDIDPQLEKKVRISQAIGDISTKIQMTGKVTDNDLARLRQLSPEYAKNFTEALKNQELVKECINMIARKIANGTLSPADLTELERINPNVAKKMKDALRAQLKVKVKEVEGKLKTVKGALAKGLNNTGFLVLQKQLDTLTGSVKPVTKKTLKEIQEKIKAAAASPATVFDRVFARLDLDYDIKHLTGESEDLKRVLTHFFNVVTKVDVPVIMKRTYTGVLSGLSNIQEWFHTLAKIVAQACDKCGSKCNSDKYLKYLMDTLKRSMEMYHIKLCSKTKWTSGFKISKITEICSNLALIKTFLNTYKRIKNNLCVEIKSKVEKPLTSVVNKWKDTRKELSSSGSQWKRSKYTKVLLDDSIRFEELIRTAYSKELGKVKLPTLSRDEIISVVDKILEKNQTTASLAQIELLNAVLEHSMSIVKQLPVFIKQNGQTSLSAGINETSQVKASFRMMVNRVMVSLKNLCTDKSPAKISITARIPILITRAEITLSQMLTSKSLKDLFTVSNRFYRLASYIPKTMGAVKKSMLPCKLRDEKIKSDGKDIEDIEDNSVKDLRAFLSSSKPLTTKTAKEMAKELRFLIGEYKDGIKSPVGKLIDQLSTYIDKSPTFNIAMMISLTPKLSIVTLNTFQESMDYVKSIFLGMHDVIGRCSNCKPQDIFGKENLNEISKKLDIYLKPMSKTTTEFISALTFAPRGLAPIKNSLEHVRIALQTLWRSETGFTMEGIMQIVNAFQTLSSAIKNIKSDKRDELYKALAGMSNKDIKKYKDILQKLNKNLIELHKRSNGQLQYLKAINEKMEGRIRRLSITSSDIEEMVSPIDRRFKIVTESADVLREFGGLFATMYSMRLDAALIKFIDTEFALEMSTLLGAIKGNGGKVLNDTRRMVKTIGVNISPMKDDDFVQIDISKIIRGMSRSAGIRKTQLARELLTKANTASAFLTDMSTEAKELSTNFIGGVNKATDSFKRFKLQMLEYGKIYDDVQSTIKQIKSAPISEIGKIKDSSITLISSLKDYDLNKLLSADPMVIPRKIKEMQTLFKVTAASFIKINVAIKNCISCQAEKILGYNYLTAMVGGLDDTFNKMFERLSTYAGTVGNAVTELQDIKASTKRIKTRFNTIFQKKHFCVNTLQQLSDALSASSIDLTSIQNATQNMVRVLFDKDVNLEIIGSSINGIVAQLSKIMTRSHEVSVKGERVYLQAKKMSNVFNKLRSNSSKLGEGPIRSRIEIAKEMAEETKILLKDLPVLFQLSNKTLHSVGINKVWMQTLGSNIVKLTSSISIVLSKTSHILIAVDIIVKGTGDIDDKLPEAKNSLKDFVDAPWDKKVATAQNASKQLNKLFNTVIDTSLKSAHALEISLNKNDLKSVVITTVGEQRLAKFQETYNDVTKMALELQKGPISNIGVLTDSVHTFVDGLSEYNFGKMLLDNPNNLQSKFLEFRQLSRTAGDIIHDISAITGLCEGRGCDITSIFGNAFLSSIIGKLDDKFTEVGNDFSVISRRVSKKLEGWKSLVDTANNISSSFHVIRTGGITNGTFMKVSAALIKSVTDVKTLSDGSSMIFQAIFNGDKDMKFLRENFEGLIEHVSGVLNKTSQILPKVGDILESVQDVRKEFHAIETDLSNVTRGPIEARISILKRITGCINNVGETLHLILNQSDTVVGKLGVDSSWYTHVAGKMVNISNSVSKVVTKTNTILDGVGFVVKHGRELQILVGGISEDYRRIVSAPWEKKFQVLQATLRKVSKICDHTDTIAESVQETLKKTCGGDVDLTGHLGNITHRVTGAIDKLKTQVQDVVNIRKDLTTTLDAVKTGPIQKIGTLTDSVKDFVNSLKNYDIVDILILGPKFTKEKLGDLKDIVHESGSLLRTIGSLVKVNCTSCNIDSIFRTGFVKDIADHISDNLNNITEKSIGILEKVEEGATNVRSIIVSVKGIEKEASKLKDINFDTETFDTLAKILHKSSDYLQVITTDSSNMFRMLYNDSVELKNLTSVYGGFITQMRAFLNKAGDFSGGIAGAFNEFEKIQKRFNETKTSIKDSTRGPMTNRIEAVKGIANGVNSIMSKFTEVLKTSKISPTWLKSFGIKLDHITRGISKVMNRTMVIATGLREPIQDIGKVIHTGEMISIEFKDLAGAGSIGSKIKLAGSIVNNIKTLTGQVNEAAGNASSAFEKLTGITMKTANIFGDGTKALLSQLSTGITTIADHYQQFQQLSKTIQNAFDKIEEDPIKFATEELPKLFDQSAVFIDLIYKDVKGIASKVGVHLDKFNMDRSIVSNAKSFYRFAKSTLNTIGSGKALVADFKHLLHSKNFKDGLANLDKTLQSGKRFIESIDQLGSDIFKNWGVIKGSFSAALNDIGQSIGVNFEKMGGYLKKGLSVGLSSLNIFTGLNDLLNIKKFNMETLVRAAADSVQIAQAGLEVATSMGVTASAGALDTTVSAVDVVASVVGIVRGIEAISKLLKGRCDVKLETTTRTKTLKYVCYKNVTQRENVLIAVENCTHKVVKEFKGYTQGKMCPTTECIYIQNVSCLASNEKCLHMKLDKTKKMPGIREDISYAFRGYYTYLQTMKSKRVAVQSAETRLKRARFGLRQSSSKWQISKWTSEKSKKTIQIMEEQKEKLEKIIKANRTLINIFKVEFNVTSHEAIAKLIPLRVHMQDDTGTAKSTLDVIANFDRESESFLNIAQLVVSNYTRYIPMYQYRIDTNSRNITHISDERSTWYWQWTCIHYHELYDILRNIISILDDGIKNSSDDGNIEASLYEHPSPSYSESDEVTKLVDVMKQFRTGTTENVQDVIARWKRTSVRIWSEDVGSACIGFSDCLDTQMENLSTIFQPYMKGYDFAIKSIAEMKNGIANLTTKHDLKKSSAMQITKQVVASLTTLKNNAHFCHESPKLTKEMPIYKLAYVESDFELPCTIEGPASMEFRWWKNKQIIPNQKSWKLELNDVTTEDGGSYQCEGKTLTASVMSNWVLIRIHNAMKIVTQPKDQILDYPGGEEVMFSCNGTAEPEAIYKWWFRRYNYGHPKATMKPVVLSQSSVLTIKRATMKHRGQYWCELSNGHSSIYSRKAKLDIVRAVQLKESARLHIALSISKHNVSCNLPKTDDSTRVTETLHAALKRTIGLPDKDDMKLKYKLNFEDDSKADLTADIRLKQEVEMSKDSVISAFHVSQERSKLQSLLTTFLNKLKETTQGLQIPWKMCNISMQSTKFAIDWRADELKCPPGMGPSTNLVKCVQCSPGTYDNGKGFCVPCPVGTYQAKAGQTRCYPCGYGMLTVEDDSPAKDDCVMTDYMCVHPMSVLVVLDASTDVSKTTWYRVKSFVSRLVDHMKIADDAVKISVVTVGSEAKLVVSSANFDNTTNFQRAIQGLEQVPGTCRHDTAFEYAKHLSQSPDYMDQHHAVLFVTQANKMDTHEDVLVNQAKEMKCNAIELFNVLLNPLGEELEPYLSIVSRPISRHLINVRDIEELSKWPTAIARSLCTSTHRVRG